MVKIKELDSKNLRMARAGVAQRAALLSIFHPILFSCMVLLDFNGVRFTQLLPALYSMTLWMLVRIFLWLRSRKDSSVWEKPIYRLALQVSAFGIGATWGLSLLFVLNHAGMSPPMVMMMIFCMGVISIGSPAYSLTPLSGFIFSILVIAPTSFALLSNPQSTAGFVLGGALWFFIAGIMIVTINLNRFQIKLMHALDVVEGQRKDLLRSNETITAMLESTGEGFLIFDRNGTCISQPSAVSAQLLNLEAFGKNIWEVLHVPPEQRAQHESWYTLLFTDTMDFADFAQVGLPQISVEPTGKRLKIKFYPIRDANSAVEAITVNVTDVTAQLKAQAEVQDLQTRAEMILRVQRNRAGFKEWLKALEDICQRLKHGSTAEIMELKREVHTLKGTAMIFSVAKVAGILYDTELRLREVPPEQLHGGFFAARASELKQHLENWRRSENELFDQMGLNREPAIELTKGKLNTIRAQLLTDQVDAKLMTKIETALQSDDLAEIFARFEPHVLKVAQDLQRQLQYRVIAPAESILIAPNTIQKALSTFVHLINNAVDHGIETPEERRAVGKPERGLVEVALKTLNHKAVITVKDDGRGIDTVAIERKVGASGGDKVTLAMHIFDQNLSTRDEVTQLSGQGIGLAAVRAAIEDAKGSIRIVKTDGAGTTFEIVLPLNSGG